MKQLYQNGSPTHVKAICVYLKERDHLRYHGSSHSSVSGRLTVESQRAGTPVHDYDVVVFMHQEHTGHIL